MTKSPCFTRVFVNSKIWRNLCQKSRFTNQGKNRCCSGVVFESKSEVGFMIQSPVGQINTQKNNRKGRDDRGRSILDKGVSKTVKKVKIPHKSYVPIL